MCPPCQAGDLSLCWSFTTGDLGPGVHVGVITGAPGAGAEQLAAHDSMLIPVPDGVSDEAAVLADPFSVSFHAIVRHPPPPGGRVLVYGAGALGLTRWPSCARSTPRSRWASSPVSRPSALWPSSSGRPPSSRPAARAWPSWKPWADWSGAVLHAPLDGLPVTHPGHIDVVYDSIAKAETLEVDVRVLTNAAASSTPASPRRARWESTPIYFKEITIAGSNAFGLEDFEGRRRSCHRPLPADWSPTAGSTSHRCSRTVSRSKNGGPRSRPWPARTDSGALEGRIRAERLTPVSDSGKPPWRYGIRSASKASRYSLGPKCGGSAAQGEVCESEYVPISAEPTFAVTVGLLSNLGSSGMVAMEMKPFLPVGEVPRLKRLPLVATSPSASKVDGIPRSSPGQRDRQDRSGHRTRCLGHWSAFASERLPRTLRRTRPVRPAS